MIELKRESTTTEFKREYTADISKTVIAFANTDGGEIFIGVADDGTVVGVDDADEIMLRTMNSIRDAVRPDVTMFIDCEQKIEKGKSVIAITVQRGTAPPYYLARKGIRPEGVYVRQGPSTVPATQSMILKMIRETGGESYERTRSLEQELTFEFASKVFKDENIKFGTEQKRSLGIIGEDGAFSNLGLFISDQCRHTAKAAVFDGTGKTLLKDRIEFSGSLLKQADEIFAYIDRLNRTSSEFSGLRRIDKRDFPREAVREALLNAIVHRDYSYSGSTLISIFEDRIEFVSLGGLPKGIAYSDLMLGVSVLRNERLGDIFYRLHLIEAYGIGMPKIMDSYSHFRVKPTIDVSENAFRITLPNTNFTSRVGEDRDRLTHDERRVMDYIALNDNAGRKDLQAELGLSQSKAVRLLRTLTEKEMIAVNGRGKNTRYTAKEK